MQMAIKEREKSNKPTVSFTRLIYFNLFNSALIASCQSKGVTNTICIDGSKHFLAFDVKRTHFLTESPPKPFGSSVTMKSIKINSILMIFLACERLVNRFESLIYSFLVFSTSPINCRYRKSIWGGPEWISWRGATKCHNSRAKSYPSFVQTRPCCQIE